ncbi:MAG: hypothetical protein V1736_03865 [Pseudomonadota bacterium]
MPIFGTRISPRLDCARQILILELKGKEVIDREEISKEDWLPYSDATAMKELGINTVICGGIRHWDLFSLRGQGIRIIPHVFGDVEDVIKLFLTGKLKSEQPDPGLRKRCCQVRNKFHADEKHGLEESGTWSGNKPAGGKE